MAEKNSAVGSKNGQVGATPEIENEGLEVNVMARSESLTVNDRLNNRRGV